MQIKTCSAMALAISVATLQLANAADEVAVEQLARGVGVDGQLKLGARCDRVLLEDLEPVCAAGLDATTIHQSHRHAKLARCDLRQRGDVAGNLALSVQRFGFCGDLVERVL